MFKPSVVFGIVALVLLRMILSQDASAQSVEIRQVPNSGGWNVRFARGMDNGQLANSQGIFATISAAKAAAADLQRFAAQCPNDALGRQMRPTRIVIEGSDADGGPPAGISPQLPNLVDRVLVGVDLADKAKGASDDAKWAATLLTDPRDAVRQKMEEKSAGAKKDFGSGSVLKEYGDRVSTAYVAAKELKDKLPKLSDDAIRQSFKKVNDAVASFNKEVDEGANFFSSGKNPIPKLKEVGPDTAKQVDQWRDALQEQFKLEQRKQ